MNKIVRNVVFGIGVALALVCGFFAIVCFVCGILDGDEGAWPIFLLFSLGCIIGVFMMRPFRFANALCKSKCYIADALRLGGKQMLCDIIKWTIIIIIAAIVFAVAYKIAVSSGKSTKYSGGYIL